MMDEREPLLVELSSALSPSEDDKTRIKMAIDGSIAATAAVGLAATSKTATSTASSLVKWGALTAVGGALGLGLWLQSRPPTSQHDAQQPAAIPALASVPAPHHEQADVAQADGTQNGIEQKSVASLPPPNTDAPADVEKPTTAVQKTPAPIPTTPRAAAPTATRTQPRPTPSAASAIAASAASADTLNEELVLLSQAQAALRQGQPAVALRRLDEHRQRFPAGKLALERNGARAIALCQMGQLHAGRQQAERVLAAAPTSPLAKRIEKTCLFSVQTP